MPDEETPGYLREPSIAGDQIIFVAEDDLWTVSAAGGTARRLTTALSSVSLPWLSPDGGLIAFVAREEGPAEVYVTAAGGGAPRQLTHLGASTATSGWRPDGMVVFTSDVQSPFPGGREHEGYVVSPDGGEPQRLPWGPAQRVAFGPGGRVVVGRNVADPARWKRYRGGTAGEFWVDGSGDGQFVHWTGPRGNLASPMWIGERVYFLSDHEGIGNLYSCRADGADLRRHTDHADFYARNAQSDGRRIVYHAGGDLYLYDPGIERSARLTVELRSQRAQRSRRFVEAGPFLDGYDLHPEGHSLVITTRGHANTLGNWEGPVLPVGLAHGVRYRLARWLPGGGRVVAVADVGGEEALEVHAAGLPDSGEPGLAGPPLARLEGIDLGRAVDMAVCPVGERVAVANHRGEVLAIDLSGGASTVVERNAFGRIAGLSWSPDGRWLCYAAAVSRNTTALRLWRAPDAGGQEQTAPTAPVTITRPVLHDVGPAFDPEGKYLYFLSYRTFDPVYDNLQFDLGFPRGVRPYLITLQADAPSPLLPAPRPLAGESKAAGEESGGDASPKPVHIDLDGIEERALALPVPEGRYRAVAGMPGKVLFLAWPVEGSLRDDFLAVRPLAKGSIESYDLTELRQETLIEGVTDFALTADGRTLAYRAEDRLRVLAAGKKPEEGKDADKAGRKSGWIDLGRVRVAVDPAQEWAQMLREAWRLQRDNFWTADMSGVDWAAVWERYSRLLPRIATRGELSDLMWEMQGELGTSHAYEMGGDYRQGPKYGRGFLGADLRWDGAAGGYRIARLVRGDGWAPGLDSPLRAPGVRVAEGDVILAVDGRPVAERVPVGELLVGKGGAEVAVTVTTREGRRTVVVKALANEHPARSRAWVDANRALVHQQSGGRLGYIHIPDMGPRGYAEFHRAWLPESERDGLVVDVRHNGGGHVSQLILEKLARRPVGYDVSRWGRPEPYPAQAVAGPLVALTDEKAGSDGDIFSHCFKLMQLGPLVGKRTWGGVIGINVRHPLVDGTFTSQPEYSFWFIDVGWGVENYGTDADIPVENAPQDYGRGADTQLGRAIQEAMTRLAERPPQAPAFGPRPSRALPTLPPR